MFTDIPPHVTIYISCRWSQLILPHISDDIRYDLLRSGSVETTINKILERGYLDPVCPLPSTLQLKVHGLTFLHLMCLLNSKAPQTYFSLYPRMNAIAPSTQEENASHSATSPHSGEKRPQTLISKFNLERRITGQKEKIREDEIGGKAVWEDTAEKREASLRERKEKMILAARQ